MGCCKYLQNKMRIAIYHPQRFCIFINSHHHSFWLHTYCRNISADIHIVFIPCFTANAVHGEVYPVPGFLFCHRLFKYFSALSRCACCFSSAILSNVFTSMPNLGLLKKKFRCTCIKRQNKPSHTVVHSPFS